VDDEEGFPAMNDEDWDPTQLTQQELENAIKNISFEEQVDE